MTIFEPPLTSELLSEPLTKPTSPYSNLEKILGTDQPSRNFWWMTGIEGTTIPQIGADEFEWIQHYRFWNEDLTMIRQELGANAIRLCFPWYKINPEKGKFDWEWMDQVVGRAAELDFKIALNPIHFGTPLWLEQSFGNTDFPKYAAEYFNLIARRYGSIEQVVAFVPHNEPTITARFGGLSGDWPPYHKSKPEYYRLLLNIAKGIVLSQEAVRAEIVDPVFLYIDAVGKFGTRSPFPSARVLKEIEYNNTDRFLCYDLLSGKVDQFHPLAPDLQVNGINDGELDWFRDHALTLDIMGLDFYSYSECWVDETNDGKLVFETDAHGPATVQLTELGLSSREVNELAPRPGGIYGVLKEYYERYKRPLILTETDYMGTVEERAAWLKYSVAEVDRTRMEGLPVLGYTWWGATDHLNWGMALRERDSIHPVGLVSLVPQPDGTLERVRTLLVEDFRRHTLRTND